MSCEIHITYVAIRALVDPTRFDQEQTLIIHANENDQPTTNVLGETQYSRGGKRKATTVFGRWLEGTINTPLITASERPYWREYLESTCEEEIHEIRRVDYYGWDEDISTLTVFRPLNTGSLSRRGNGDRYKANFKWRQVDV